MEHNFREWDVISNDPNGLEVTDEQLRATNNQFQQQQKFDRTEDELMLLGDEDDSLEPEKMDDQMEEELLGRASAVSTNKLTSAIKLNNEKTGKNERPKGIKSMFGAKYEENYKRFQYNLYGAPPVEPIQFGGGMDLSLMSNKSGGSINNSSSGTMTGNRSDGKAKAKKSGTVATKSAMGKRILKRKVVQNPVAKKASTDMSKKWGGQNVANRLKKRRSRSLDTALNSKWNTSSSFLDVTSSTDHSSFFEDRKMSRPIVGQNCSISSNPKFKQNSAKFSFFSSTERMMSEWVKKKGNGAIGAKFDEEKNGQQNGGESDDAGGEESADEQQQPQSDDEGRDEDDTLNFLGLLKHKETPKSKQYAQRNNSRRMSTTNDEYEDTSPCYAFSPKTTLFVCPVPPTLDENGLKCYFLSFGEVRSVVVPFNPITGEHRGFGFVDFVSEHSAKAAYEKRGQIWPRGGLKAFNLTWYRAKRVFSPPLPGTEIFVFELGQKCTESALFSYFGRYGHIEFAQIGHTSDGGRAALIRFTERRSAALAIEGNPEHCEWAKNEAETREQYVKQEETPPMKKWVNVFDLSKSVVRDSSALFRQNRRSADVAQTIQKQFFPDIQKGRSRSVGRFLSTDDDASYNYTPDNKSFTYHGESSPVQFEDENVQAQQHSARRRRNSNQTQNSTGTKRRLVGASSSDDDDSPQRTIVKSQSSREGRSLFRSSVDANQCNEGKAATAPTAQLHRSRSQKPKNGRNSFAEGGGAFLNTPSPSLPSSSTSSLALESSFVSTEGNRQKEVTTNSSSVFRDKYALFNQFLDFLEWKEKSKKSV